VNCGDRIAPDGHAPVTVAGGWAHSGRLSDRLQGTLRSPTFTVPEIGIGVRCAGSKCRLRLVVDGYYQNERNELLFDNFIQGVDHPNEWRTHAWDAKRYAGEQAYIEVIDDGDGFIAVDWVSLGMVTGLVHKLHVISNEFTLLPTGVSVDKTEMLAVVTDGNVPVANPRMLFN
jgi:hypothetical protein